MRLHSNRIRSDIFLPGPTDVHCARQPHRMQFAAQTRHVRTSPGNDETPRESTGQRTRTGNLKRPSVAEFVLEVDPDDFIE